MPARTTKLLMFEFDIFYADYYNRHRQAPQDWQADIVPSPDLEPFLPSPDRRQSPLSPPEEDELLGHFYSESDDEESDDEISDDEEDDNIENRHSF